MLAEISIIPIGEGVSISSYVARTANIIDESGLDYRINPMATVVEGEFDQIMSGVCRRKGRQNPEEITGLRSAAKKVF